MLQVKQSTTQICPLTSDNGMNSVRGLAAIIVVLAHAIQIFILRITGTENLLAIISSQMALQSVYVFFIVSGYLITQSIFKNYQRNGKVFNAVEYFTSRISRIYPPLLFAIALIYSINFMLEILNLPGSTLSIESLGLPEDLYQARERFIIENGGLKNTLLMRNGMLQTNGPLWSLCIEWRIYLVAGVIAMLFTSNTYLTRIILILIAIFTFIKLRQVNEHYAFYTCVWLIGCMISLYKIYRGNLTIPIYIKTLIIIVFTTFLLLHPEYLSSKMTTKTTDGFVCHLLLCLTWSTFLFPIKPKSVTQFHTLLMSLGNYSYTLFIIHFPIMLGILSISIQVTGHNLVTALSVAIFSVTMSLLISYHASKYFENKTAFIPHVYQAITLPQFFLKKIWNIKKHKAKL